MGCMGILFYSNIPEAIIYILKGDYIRFDAENESPATYSKEGVRADQSCLEAECPLVAVRSLGYRGL